MLKEEDLNLDEAAWFRIQASKMTYLLGVLYRPEYVNLTVGDPCRLEVALTRAAQLSSRVILTGDLNIDLLKKTANTKKLTALCEDVGLLQRIEAPTRIDGDSATLLDHVWTTEECNVGKSGVIAGISDHLATFLELQSPTKEPEIEVTCRSYKNYNIKSAQDLYTELIHKSELKKLIEDKDMDLAMDEWIRVMREVCDSVAPITTFTKKKEEQHVPWFNSEVHHLKDTREALLDIQHSKKHLDVKDTIKTITNKLKSVKRKLKKEYLAKNVEEKANDGRKLWQLLREATNTTQVREDTEPDNVDQNITDHFNKYFAKFLFSIIFLFGV